MANFYYNQQNETFYSDEEFTIPADISTATADDYISDYSSLYGKIPTDVYITKWLQDNQPNYTGKVNYQDSDGIDLGNNDWPFYAYYINGVKTTLNEYGTGTWNGLLYEEAGILNGEYNNIWYIGGIATTLDIYGNGIFEGLRYVDGSLVPSGIYENKPYWYGSGSNLDGADFSNQDLSTVDFSDVRSVVGANFSGATLDNIGNGHNGQTYPNSTVPAYLLEGANFYNATIKNCHIEGYPQGANFSDTRFENCDITGDFSSDSLSVIDQISFTSCIIGANFAGANMYAATFINNTFTEAADFTGASYGGYLHIDGENVGLNPSNGFTFTGENTNYSGSVLFYMNGEATTLYPGGNGFWNNEAYFGGQKQPTGWNDWYYYINNVETTLDSSGNGFWSDKAYSNGYEQPTGWNGSFYYINNVETTLGEGGYGMWNGTYYIAGEGGYGMWNGTYYIAGVATTLDNTGSGFWNGVAYYFDGENPTGWNGYFYYIDNVATTLGGSGTGDWNGNHYSYGYIQNDGYDHGDGVYYINAQATTLDSSGNGFWNNKAYSNGYEQPTGWNGSFYYIDNVVADLDSNGSGFWNGMAYVYGQEQPTGPNGYFYYIDNVETTLDAGGNGEWNGQTYVDGVVQGGGGGSVNLESGLQAFYKLSDTSDSSGNNRTLTNNGNVSFAAGKLGNAASFDGSNQLQVVNPIAEGTEYSVAGWVNFSNFDSLQYAFSFGNDMGVLYHNGVEPAEVIFTPTGGAYIGVGTPSANDWHFIYASRKANGDYTISIDNGALVTGNAGETYHGTFEIGNLLNGSMDAVGIWSRSLTESEITELYNSGTGLELGTTPTLNTLTKIQGNAKFYGKVKFGV